MSSVSQELTVTIFGRDMASAEFNKVTESARTSATTMKDLTRDVVALGMSAAAVGRLGEMFGLLNAEQARVLTDMGSMAALAVTVARGYELLAARSWAVTIAEKARAIAHAVAHALSGPAGWAILAVAATTAAVAIGWATSQIRDAADAQRDFNAAVAEMPPYPARNIERAGEEGMLRRGVE